MAKRRSKQVEPPASSAAAARSHGALAVLAWVAVASVALLVVLANLQRIWFADYWWLWKTGELVLTSGVPRVDTFSFTNPGVERLELRWGFCVALYRIVESLGVPAAVLLKTSIVAGAFGLAAWIGGARRRPLLAAGLVTIALMASAQRLLVRPETLSNSLLVLFVALVELSRRRPTRWIWALPFAEVLWVNVHGLFPLGTAVVGAWLVAELVDAGLARRGVRPADEDRSRRIRTASLVLGATIVAWFVNPYGWRAVLLPLVQLISLYGTAQKTFIGELASPFSFGLSYTALYYYYALIVVVVASAIASWRRQNTFWLIVTAAMLYLSTTAIRNIPLFALVAIPFVLRNAARTPALSRALAHSRGRMLSAAGAVVLIGFCLYTARLVVTDRMAVEQYDTNQFGVTLAEHRYPIAATSFLDGTGEEGPIFTTVLTGSYLLSQDYRVFIDPRMEVYLDGVIDEWRALVEDPSRLEEYVSRYDLRVFVLETRMTRLVPELLASSAWRLVHADDVAVVFFRDDVAPDVPAIVLDEAWLAERRARLPEPRAYDSLGFLERVANPAPYARLGTFCYLAGRHALAYVLYQDALRAHSPTFPPLDLEPLADTASRLGDHGPAARYAARAADVLAEDADAQTRAANAALAIGDTDRAWKYASRAVALAPDDAGAAGAAGAVAVRRGDAATAVRWLERAARSSPDSATLWRNLAYAHVLAKDTAAAIEAFERALAIEPEHATAARDLAMLLLARGRTEDARRWARVPARLTPEDPKTRELLRRLDTP